MSSFEKFAEYLEDTYGVQYDREERFVCCPECAEPLYEDDWTEDEYTAILESGAWSYFCPVCEEKL